MSEALFDLAPIDKSRPGPPPGWSRDLCDDWIARFRGTAPGGIIGRAIKPLFEKHSWEEIRAAWRVYLSKNEARFADPWRFANTFGEWAGTVAAPRKLSKGDEFMRRQLARVAAASKEDGR